ncbi:MAG: ATP-binding protein [Fimbriimonas sp.]
MDRGDFSAKIDAFFETFPVVALLGPRQCGKTTLARAFASSRGALASANHFDLESDVSRARLSAPFAALESLKGLVVIDEIQLAPELFSTLRVLVDRPPNDTQFLVLGSASPDLIRQSSQTLAGRVGYIELTPFGLQEVGPEALDTLWVRGGFPRSFLARSEAASVLWRENYVRTYVERDLPALGMRLNPLEARRFWTMLAHYHGQIWNAAEIAQSMSLSVRNVQSALDILEGSFMIRRLLPWYENIGKRQVKSPKIFLRDSGLFHRLLAVDDRDQLLNHPKLGASWEGFALEAIIAALEVPSESCFFWRTHNGAELDLLVHKDGRKRGFEVKFGDAPRMTKSMASALEDLQLDDLTVVYPGKESYTLTEKVRVLSIRDLATLGI